jgi:L-alanine-DL-glutamate epimerase-like enolase superfamily enzyme
MSLATNQAFTVARVDAWAYRFPIDQPVKTSFGVMFDRPAVFLRMEDTDGCYGFGEVFANWPVAAAEHRVNLLNQDFPDLLLGQRFDSPTALFDTLTRQTHTRVIQSGEWGPFRQVIAGLDTAAWDLVARRHGLPLNKILQETATDRVPVYASGIHIGNASTDINQCREAGFRRFKVKVGFDIELDARSLNDIARDLHKDEDLFADANQAWTADEAISFVGKIKEENLQWLEEPLAADAPEYAWSQLLSNTRVPLAAGENIAGHRAFLDVIHGHVLSVIQPDVAKWGGVSGCFEIGCAAVAVGKRYCPHFLGGGIGLLASAHLLAAVGGDGVLEVDVNPNPLRHCFEAAKIQVNNGQWKLSDSPGLGVEQLPREIASWLTMESVRC